MNEQLDLLRDYAVARNDDPSTSHAAAASIDAPTLRQSQKAVLWVIEKYGPCDDTSLQRFYQREYDKGTVPRQSVSGVRTRRRELADAQLVYDTRKRVELASGRMAIVWAVAQHG